MYSKCSAVDIGADEDRAGQPTKFFAPANASAAG